MAESVKVIVRCRPMNNREITLKCKSVVQMDSELCSCSIVNPADNTAPPKTFTFDGVYNTNSTTEEIYNEIAYPLVEGVLEGYNSTVFAYGQTGCGKSFSMQGITDPPSQKGIIPRAFEHIFEAISVTQGVKFLVLASYLEIYNEEIRDLLGPDIKQRLELKENPEKGIYVQDLTWHAVGSVGDCERLMSTGWMHRSTGATLMNADSSRSHSIFSVCVEMMSTSEELERSIKKGKLSLVDLAGSERQAKTGAIGERLKEASKINLSLSALGNVISALVDGKAKHIPYRDSKLTRLLQDSLGGNTKTLMVACLSPADNNYDESLSTLRYANRAKNICNKPHINEDPKDTLLRKYQEEIENLKKMLTIPKLSTIVDEAVLMDEREKIKLEYEKEIEALKEQYAAVHNSKCKMEEEIQQIKSQYENQIKNINKKSVYNNEILTIVDGEIKDVGVSTSPAVSPNGNTESKPNQKEILSRLAKLQRSLVGGERANDESLKDRRAKRKRAAEKKLAALAEVLSKEEHSSLVLGVYDDIQDQLTARSEALKKYKLKIKTLEREIADLQSEFESERTDYLETIRRLEQQTMLYTQIIEKIIPTLKNQFNYSNIETIKAEAEWDEDSYKWILPELTILRTKLPPAGRDVTTKQDGRPMEPQNEHKLEHNEDEDFAGNYFKPKRATELLIKAQQEAARAHSNTYGNKGLNTLPGSLNGLNNMTSRHNDIQQSFLNNSWNGSHSPQSYWADSPSRRPIKLEALPLSERRINHKPQLNKLDVI